VAFLQGDTRILRFLSCAVVIAPLWHRCGTAMGAMEEEARACGDESPAGGECHTRAGRAVAPVALHNECHGGDGTGCVALHLGRSGRAGRGATAPVPGREIRKIGSGRGVRCSAVPAQAQAGAGGRGATWRTMPHIPTAGIPKKNFY